MTTKLIFIQVNIATSSLAVSDADIIITLGTAQNLHQNLSNALYTQGHKKPRIKYVSCIRIASKIAVNIDIINSIIIQPPILIYQVLLLPVLVLIRNKNANHTAITLLLTTAEIFFFQIF
jgi:hypothetical protein